MRSAAPARNTAPLARAASHMALTVSAHSRTMADAVPASVLVVDDDAPIRRMLERTLEAEGYAVAGAGDGGAALAAPSRAAGRDRARRRHARHRRARRRPPAAGEGGRDADPAADRPRRGRRSGRRPRRRRRRLPGEAVRGRRAARPGAGAAAPHAARPMQLGFADLLFDPHPHGRRGGRAVELTAREAALLALLVRHPGRSSPARGARPRCGGTAARPAPTPSTATSPICAASSASRR